MRSSVKLVLLVVLAVAASLGIYLMASAAHARNRPRAPAAREEAQPNAASPVIVELFTSEGCSDCPPADRLLYQLAQTQSVPGAAIIPLEQHVDYWDSDGWRDPFSSSQFTHRQEDYVYAFNAPTAYTPQMVVDGAAQFVGSDQRRALAAIAQAAKTPKANLQLELRPDANSSPRSVPLRVSIASLPGGDPKHGADVLLAVTEDDLASNITRGENAGVQLNHRAVVRQLRTLGRVDSSGAFTAQPDLSIADGWKRENLHVVVFVQDRGTKHILGASTLSLADIAK